VDVRVESDDGRFDPRRWNGFWGAFIHAIRNAVDHGLESNSERVSMGKPPNGRVTLRTFVRDERFVVEISDDGRGMDWGAIALKAKELGIPAETQADLQAALFQQGISTAAQVTDVSGRGIGMGAVHAATKELGGRLEINTTAGRGTTVRMTFPRGAMSADLSPPQTSVATMAAFGA
jgi:two-component system chemotaxis sensor kinase CheA